MTIDIEHFKKKLTAEKKLVEHELKSVGRKNPDNVGDWEPVAANLNIDPAEIEERASEISSFEEQSDVEFTLEKRWNEINAALERIAGGTFGVCRVCGQPIETDRLEANYSAETCKVHMG